jgi:hypothetical protein
MYRNYASHKTSIYGTIKTTSSEQPKPQNILPRLVQNKSARAKGAGACDSLRVERNEWINDFMLYSFSHETSNLHISTIGRTSSKVTVSTLYPQHGLNFGSSLANKAPTWAQLRPTWLQLWPNRAQLGPKLDQQLLPKLGSTWAQHCGHGRHNTKSSEY